MLTDDEVDQKKHWPRAEPKPEVCGKIRLSNYRSSAFRKRQLHWSNSLDSKSSAHFRLVIDATGGKKSMSVAAGMIVLVRGLEVVYVDSHFDTATRKPRPWFRTNCFDPVCHNSVRACVIRV